MLRMFTDLTSDSIQTMLGQLFMIEWREAFPEKRFQLRPIRRPAAWDTDLLPEYLGELLSAQSRIGAVPRYAVYNAAVPMLVESIPTTHPSTFTIALTSWPHKRIARPFAKALNRYDVTLVATEAEQEVLAAAGVNRVGVIDFHRAAKRLSEVLEPWTHEAEKPIMVAGGRWQEVSADVEQAIGEIDTSQAYQLHVVCSSAPTITTEWLDKLVACVEGEEFAGAVSQAPPPGHIQAWFELAAQTDGFVAPSGIAPLLPALKGKRETDALDITALEEHAVATLRSIAAVRTPKPVAVITYREGPSAVSLETLRAAIRQIDDEVEAVVVVHVSDDVLMNQRLIKALATSEERAVLRMDPPAETGWSLAQARNYGARYAINLLDAKMLLFCDADVLMPIGGVTRMAQLLRGEVDGYPGPFAVVTGQVINGDTAAGFGGAPAEDFPWPTRPTLTWVAHESTKASRFVARVLTAVEEVTSRLPIISARLLDRIDEVELRIIRRLQRIEERSGPDAGWSPTRPATGIAMVKADAFVELRGYDESFIGYGAEDIDFIDRARKSELGWFQDLELVAYHYPHPPSAFKGSKHEVLNEQRTLERMARKEAAVVNPDGWGGGGKL